MTDYPTPYDAHFEAALGLLKAGRSADEVFRHVDVIGDENYRDGTLGKMGRFFAAQGQLEESLRFCRAIRDPLEYADMLFEVGRELRKSGFLDSAKGVFKQAIEAAERLKLGAWEMPAIFLQVSDELWNLGEKNEASELLQRAIELAKQPPQPFEASKTLAGCARMLSRWGNPQRAIEVAQAIESPEQRRTVLDELQKGSIRG
jgi:tetratricopeptide (TPR) repeat protein